MSDPLVSRARTANWRPRRIRLDDVPALFSEGPEPETQTTPKIIWPRAEAKKLRLTARWAEFASRLADRSKSIWPNILRA